MWVYTADSRYVKCLYFSLIFTQVNTALVVHLSFTASCSWWGLRLEISSMNMSQWGRNWSRQWMSWQERWNSSMTHLPSQLYSEISYKKTKLLYMPWWFCFFNLSLFFRNLIIENFIPPEEKNKIINRLHFDSEEDQWKVLPLLPSEKYVKEQPSS